MQLTNEQKEALDILKNRIKQGEKISILQGYAGTGKSTTLRFLLDELNYFQSDVNFVAYTGTAAKLLMDVGLRASTIHRLIYTPIFRYGVCVGFRKKSREDLEGIRLIVVDEYSMLPEELLKDLEQYDIPLLLVGDPEQLPSIGTPNRYVNQYHAILTTVHRQALDSPILWAATKIREREILKEGSYGDILFIGRKHQLNESWLRKDVQFLCGLNDTRHRLNLEISGSPNPMVGEKIILLKNDWDQGLVNGSIGHIKKITKQWDKYKLNFTADDLDYADYLAYFKEFPPRPPRYVKNAFDKAYCITTHKAQGATIDSPMVIIDESSYFKEYKTNWLYTALTRANGKHKVALLR